MAVEFRRGLGRNARDLVRGRGATGTNPDDVLLCAGSAPVECDVTRGHVFSQGGSDPHRQEVAAAATAASNRAQIMGNDGVCRGGRDSGMASSFLIVPVLAAIVRLGFPQIGCPTSANPETGRKPSKCGTWCRAAVGRA